MSILVKFGELQCGSLFYTDEESSEYPLMKLVPFRLNDVLYNAASEKGTLRYFSDEDEALIDGLDTHRFRMVGDGENNELWYRRLEDRIEFNPDLECYRLGFRLWKKIPYRSQLIFTYLSDLQPQPFMNEEIKSIIEKQVLNGSRSGSFEHGNNTYKWDLTDDVIHLTNKSKGM